MSRKSTIGFLPLEASSRKVIDTGKTVEIEGKEYPDYISMGLAYAELVALEKIPSCRYMVLAAQRFLDMYKQANSGEGEYYWSIEHAIEPCAFLESLTHIKGVLAKKPFILQPWQIWIVIAIYGFRWRDNGFRVVTVVNLEITRKSGKSLLAAGIALYELGPNANIGDDLYIIAPTEAQATKVLEPMSKMVEYNPPLKAHYNIQVLKKKLTFELTESYAVMLSSKGEHQDGHDPKVIIADEFHTIPASIYKVMKSSQGARPESLFWGMGSAGYRTYGIAWDERNEAIEVLEGKKVRLDLFVVIYTIDPKDMGNWKSERVIRKANPNYGISLDKRKIKQEIEGIYSTPTLKNEVLRTRFNIWGMGASKLFDRDRWEECFKDIPASKLENVDCYLGVDLATRNDMVCWVLEFEIDGIPHFIAKHYVPEEGLWNEDEDVRDIYRDWHAKGYLKFTPGSYHTYDEIEHDILEAVNKFKVKVIAIDDREANALAGSLKKKVSKNTYVDYFRKVTAKYSEPTKDLIARVSGKTKGVSHDGNPILSWNVENVIGEFNTAEMVLPKKISPHSNMKIDGFDGMVMCHAGFMGHIDIEEPKKPNPMAERGVRQL